MTIYHPKLRTANTPGLAFCVVPGGQVIDLKGDEVAGPDGRSVISQTQ